MRQVRHHKAGSSQADKVSASTFVEFKRYSLVVINGRLFKLNFDGRQFPYPRNDSKLIRLVEVVVDLTGDDVPLIILDLQGSVHGGIDSGILFVRSRGSGNDGCTLAIGEVAGGRDGVTVVFVGFSQRWIRWDVDLRLVHRSSTSKIILPSNIPRWHAVLRGDHSRVRLQNFAIFPAIDIRLDYVSSWMEPPVERLERDSVRLFRDVENRFGLIRVGTQRLFNQDVLSRLHRLYGPFRVQTVRHGDVNGVNFRVLQQVFV